MAGELGLHCAICGKQTLHKKAGSVNHVLHFLITFFTCGLWGLVWLILAVTQSNAPYVCTFCGNQSMQGLWPGPAARAANPEAGTRGFMIAGAIIAGLIGLIVVKSVVTSHLAKRRAAPPSTTTALTPATSTLPRAEPPRRRNPSNEALAALSATKRDSILKTTIVSAGEDCGRVERVVYKGIGPDGAGFWGVGCSSGRSYVVSVEANATGSTKVLDCALLPDCFKRFQ